MNKITLALALFSASTTFAMAASNNTITFQGEVTAQTCSVTVNGADANPMVLLPTVSSSDLDVSGKTAGKTAFTLGVTGCAPGVDDIDIKTYMHLLDVRKTIVNKNSLNAKILE